MKRFFVLVLFLFFQCASTSQVWSNYSLEYFGTEADMNKFLKVLSTKNCEYQIQTLDNGVYEVKYRDSVKKN